MADAPGLWSSRSGNTTGKQHLGLGLYMARLIAEHHQGSINMGNLPDNSGVRVSVKLPLTQS